jgi:very-short-patch-repair endonuclease
MEPSIQTAIAALAAKQQNNITRDQLLALGMGAKAIDYRTRTGRYFRVHKCVYSLGHPPQTPHQKAAAAVLASGPGAALSHGSAMALWGFWKRWPASFDVTVTRDRRPKGITVHLSRTLHRRDVTTHYGIRATTPARTLHDRAPNLSDAALARAVNDALLSPYLTRSQLAEFLARHPNRRLQPFVETTDGPTRSQFEDAFLAFCENHDLPRPRINTIVAGREVDAYFEAERLIVELDGWDFHSSRLSFEDDRARDANALASGIATLRITWERMTETPGREAARLHKILQGRRG